MFGNTTSVAGLLLTTEAMTADKPDSDDESVGYFDLAQAGVNQRRLSVLLTPTKDGLSPGIRGRW